MKWLVQTLDALISNRLDHEAIAEQKKLEQLIIRYKNLIPTIEITMTKTDIYSKSYTYRKEVREVCTLLRKVREQSKDEVPLAHPENLPSAVAHQETRLQQLEQQRANIVSMLQRGKDLLKDQHAPTFISSEVQQLEVNWNDTYGQSIETLKSLKNTQKLWTAYKEQKTEVLKLMTQAEEELNRVKSSVYSDAAQMSADLQNKQEFSSTLEKSAKEMMTKLRDIQSNLSDVTPLEKKELVDKEIIETEKKVETTLKVLHKTVVHLQEYNSKWIKFQSKFGELQNWTQQRIPQSLAEIENYTISPEERLHKTENLQKEIHEKIKILKSLKEESQTLQTGKVYFIIIVYI